MKISRKNVIPNEIIRFEFDVSGFEFLVKNLTSADILVSFDSFDENKNIKIPSYMSQIVTQNTNHKYSSYKSNALEIKASAEGEVEVQCMTW